MPISSLQVGGFKLPFLSVGSCVVALVIPCALVVRNISEFLISYTTQVTCIFAICIEPATKKKVLPAIVALNFSTDFDFIMLSKLSTVPMMSHLSVCLPFNFSTGSHDLYCINHLLQSKHPALP